MLLDKRSILYTFVAACLVSLLTSCANSSTKEALERSFAVDPKLKDNTTVLGDSQQSNLQDEESAQLPENFPVEIPRYPQAKLKGVESLTVPSVQGQRTTWSSSDPSTEIRDFYKRAFESGAWQVVSQPDEESSGTFVARRNDLQVTVSIPATPEISDSEETPSSNQDPTKFEIQYILNSTQVTTKSSEQQESVSSNTGSQQTLSKQPQDVSNLDKVPESLRQYVKDLAALGVLSVNQSGAKSSDTTGNQFDPNKTITRREYARWLVAANNRIHANRPGLQIRLASDTSQSAFQDVPKSDPDFQSIQALAEAGLIPSPLTGEATAVQFRPDAPLTRENLIAWKVPLDIRGALPSASLDAVKQTWGFQDAGKIDPNALRAVLADFQNGDQANIRRIFGYTTLFQPKKSVTRAEAAAGLWYFGSQGEGISGREALSFKSQESQSSESEESTTN
ncbi:MULTISPECIES: S-layer homology domain-containing protein [unclassified Coleofasciculus]|uniref:S-layer homology domain-containing protein n=1 Tax=unclassified Coleofasciculus TaxID=2692782 RepID=UPI00187F5E75|nr:MULTISPECIES: S-layer homology domain-containing protein [unclassified Coleofasciculus]MBE9129365.1 S-layer homology domain-containing protein [Coleofasciculus sp. LEGE 07081]MBE9151465.1 S-layer homology domain-containing protein [Coleofasciculus sp. LEGE 07092]